MATCYCKQGLDPTIVVGGEVNAWEGNARLGQGAHLVAEADESDGSLVKMAASVGIVTNIELDHPDHYNNLDEVIAIFQNLCPALSNADWLVSIVKTVRDQLQPTISYSLDRNRRGLIIALIASPVVLTVPRQESGNGV